MNYFSTNKQAPVVDFREAAIRGQAPDKGLYFPAELPVIDPAMIRNLAELSNEEIAFRVIHPYVGDSIPEEELYCIAGESIAFDIPLREITKQISSLELFHGPTLAFKDVGARFMSRCLAWFLKEEQRKVTVLVATSGDTGGAVASGFHDVRGVEVVILYPSGKVSPVQEKQLTTLGGNIRAIEIDGTFDDCQALVKQAFMDQALNERLFLTSANSINVARWLPQQFYYFFAVRQWDMREQQPVISVPSGNFGNICAGLLARHTGLPVARFIAACNANDVVPRYLQSGTFDVHSSVSTISNAMDVGNPSNFVRILEIFHHDLNALKNVLTADTISDEDTLATIRRVKNDHHYLLDPHGAVAWLALERYQAGEGKTRPGSEANPGIILETAHPVKFPDPVLQATGEAVPVPEAVNALMKATKQAEKMSTDFGTFRDYLLAGADQK